MTRYKFIQKAIRNKASLSTQLNINENENIPIELLNTIISTRIGTLIHNPTNSGKRVIKVTRLLKRRAVLARTLKTIR